MDAAEIFAIPELMDLKLRQIAFADMLVLNKADLVSRDELDKIRAWLDDHFWRYRLVESVRGDVPLPILLSAGRLDPAVIDCCGHGHLDKHRNAFSTWSFAADEPLSLELLRECVKKLPASIYRCKGVIHCVDAPERRAILQVVGKRVDLAYQDDWGGRTPRTQIVCIGAHGEMDDDTLRSAFDRCVAIQT